MWLIGGLIGILISNMLFGEGWNIIIGFIIGSFIGNIISLYIKEKREIAEQKYKREQAEKERLLLLHEENRKQEIERKYQNIQKKYPNGLALFEKIKSSNDVKISREQIIKHEDNISQLEQTAIQSNIFDEWENEQINFSNLCYNKFKKICPNWGRYQYYIEYDRINNLGQKEKGKHIIWNFFLLHADLDEALDYTDHSYEKIISKNMNGTNFQNNMFINEKNCNELKKFISAIGDVYIIYKYYPDFNFSFHSRLDYPIEKTNLLELKRAILKNFSYDRTSPEYVDLNGTGFINELEAPSSRLIFILDLITTNQDIKSICTHIYNKFSNKKPLICYISMCKYLESIEKQELITKREKQVEQNRLEIKNKVEVKNYCLEAVKNWQLLKGNFRYTYLFNYYPLSCYFKATDEEWKNRWTIWNFRNIPRGTSPLSHAMVLYDIVPRIKLKLTDTFGENNLKYLTLVCLPASRPKDDERRYKEFSQKLCSETGMINSYDKISVTGKEIIKYLGEFYSPMSITFDTEFFKDKYVIIFDDTINSGNSMLSFKSKMEQMGATVICGIAIGKTKRQRS